jgi:hypothetical protein
MECLRGHKPLVTNRDVPELNYILQHGYESLALLAASAFRFLRVAAPVHTTECCTVSVGLRRDRTACDDGTMKLAALARQVALR